jgi:hypothetical protein
MVVFHYDQLSLSSARQPRALAGLRASQTRIGSVMPGQICIYPALPHMHALGLTPMRNCMLIGVPIWPVSARQRKSESEQPDLDTELF